VGQFVSGRVFDMQNIDLADLVMYGKIIQARINFYGTLSGTAKKPKSLIASAPPSFSSIGCVGNFLSAIFRLAICS
jgi:hypothetical protein